MSDDRKLGIACPKCGRLDSEVVESRPARNGVRRRRRCCGCGHRSTTYERIVQNDAIDLFLEPDRIKTLYCISGDRLRRIMSGAAIDRSEMAEIFDVRPEALDRYLFGREVVLSKEQWRSLESLADNAADKTKNDRL